MAYVITDTRIGAQPIAVTDTTQNHPIGTVVRAKDPTYGEGEFVYLLGVASTVVGSVVTYNATTGQTTLAAVGANKPFPVAIAMSANVASSYGWYQISGIAVALKSSAVSLAAGIAVGLLTAGRIAATGSGKELQGAMLAAVASASASTLSATLVIDRPHIQGRIT